MHKKLFLCSNSPRRFSLLRALGVEFEKLLPEGGGAEEKSSCTRPFAVCRDIARTKALNCAPLAESGILMGFDTIVVCDGRILGKPGSMDDAFMTLKSLSGRWHFVYTGVCLISRPDGRIVCGHERTRVRFRDLSDRDIERYLGLVDPMDKAGAYNIEEYGGLICGRVDGCFWNVVGLPVARLRDMLGRFGIDLMELAS